jgi:hypothetical protein
MRIYAPAEVESSIVVKPLDIILSASEGSACLF